MAARRALRLALTVLCFGACGAGGGLGAEVCARGLAARQRALCLAAPAAVAALGTGLSMAYAECRAQMAGRRWNCSGVGDDNRLGHVMPLATKETAFTYALAAAGGTHALAAACAAGDLPACSCTGGRRRAAAVGGRWEWGGCGAAAWGARFARRFLDARELELDARAAMNLHNNRLGRKVVQELARRECKCHGVSGSCAVRTCWRALPPFRAVGAALRDRLRRARLVEPAPHPPGNMPTQLLIKRREGVGRPARRSELVFLAPSPAYCDTSGRHCNHSSTGEDGCESLCCGRGYSTVREVRESRCHCAFHWCCRVSCRVCVSRTDVHVCN